MINTHPDGYRVIELSHMSFKCGIPIFCPQRRHDASSVTVSFVFTDGPTTTSLSLPSISNRCVKCEVVKKSDKRSCCARGGAWFKNCGDAGDTKFDHTWIEGVKACEGVVSLVLVESPIQEMLRQVGVTDPRLDAAVPTIIAQHQTDSSRHVNAFNVGATDSKECFTFAQVAVCICVLFVLFHLQT